MEDKCKKWQKKIDPTVYRKLEMDRWEGRREERASREKEDKHTCALSPGAISCHWRYFLDMGLLIHSGVVKQQVSQNQDIQYNQTTGNHREQVLWKWYFFKAWVCREQVLLLTRWRTSMLTRRASLPSIVTKSTFPATSAVVLLFTISCLLEYCR